MPKSVWSLQSNLNRGELDPQLVGRKDLQAYYNGVATGKDTVIIPQGGQKRRGGTEYIDESLDGRLEEFSFNTEQRYLLVFTDGKMSVYKDDVLVEDINGTGNDYLVVPWTTDNIRDFDYSQSIDTVIITHEDVQTRTITRTSDSDWVLASAPFTNIPEYDFNDSDSPTTIDEVQIVGFGQHTVGDRYKLALEGVLSEEIVFSSENETNCENIRFALQNLINTGNSGISVTTNENLLSYEVTFSGDSAKNWGILTGSIIYSFTGLTAITVVRVQMGWSRKEPAWGTTRGWPRTNTFHNNRLWLGGSRSLPDKVWGSRSFDYFNFDTGRAFDDEAIASTLDTDQVNAITGVFSNRTLQVFTTGGEFYCPVTPITPEEASFPIQSARGSKRIRPVSIDGVTLFVQASGKSIIRFLYVNDIQSIDSRPISNLAPHLIKNPIKLAVSRGNSDTDANYLYILNEDGSISVFNTLESEDVAGFTDWPMENCTVKDITTVSNVLYLLVEREVNGATVYYIEKENQARYLDSSVYAADSAATITGLDHLEGETVRVRGGGYYLGEFTVSGGSVTLPRSYEEREAGLEFNPKIVTMPLNIQTPDGPIAAQKKKIKQAAIQMYETIGIIVNGHRFPDRTLGLDVFSAPTPYTGLKRMYLPGWSLEAQITIEQDTPMPFTILGIYSNVVTG